MARSIKVVRYKHGIRLYADDVYGHQVVQQYCKRHLLKPLTPVGTKQDVDPEGGDLFYIESESHRITIVHISQEKALLNYLTSQGIHYSIEDKEAYQGNPTVFNKHTLNLIEPEGTKYTWQNSASILIAEEDHNTFEVQTGKGKTAAAQKGTVLKGVVTAYVTKPAYLGKWVGDIEEGLGLTLDEDFLLVDNVERLINLVTYGGDPKVKAYLVSSFCIDNYIKRWTEDPDEVPDPDQVWRALGVGLVVYDEAHEVFRMQYWSAMALSPYAILDLSATLLPDEPFLKHRYAERFPLESRLSLDYEAYVDVIGLAFTIQDRKIAQRINKQGMYQHHVFESKVMSKKQALNNYFEMLYKILDKWYLKERQEGQKALFMFATRAMCTEFFDFVKARCPDLNVKRYIEGDKYAEAKEADIIISTPGKSGTGVDYVGLVLNVICVSVNASQKSMQMLGRTRDGCIQRWGIRPRVVYPLCTTIIKQVVYYNRRRKLLAGRVNSLITMNTGIAI